MKVILIEDVKSLGKKGQIVEVSDGYAINFLIAKKLAVKATDKSLELKKEEETHAKQELEVKKQEMVKLKNQLNSIKVVLRAKGGKDGKMFGSISTKQIAEEINLKHNITIDKRKFLDNNPINTFGHTKLKIELFKDVVAEISVEVLEQN